jgi:hypothetical protein
MARKNGELAASRIDFSRMLSIPKWANTHGSIRPEFRMCR